MRSAPLDRHTLRLLADTKTNQAEIWSVYFSLQTDQNTADSRASLVQSLFHQGHEQLKNLAGESTSSLEADLQTIHDFLQNAPSNHLALFYGHELDFYVDLQEYVKPGIYLNHNPLIEPLIHAHHETDWAVLLVNRRHSRLFRGSQHGFFQIKDSKHYVPGQHNQGGWSQSRYARHIENSMENHLEITAQDLFEYWKQNSFKHLIIAGPHEIQNRFTKHLHTYVAATLEGCLELDVEHSSTEDINTKSVDIINNYNEIQNHNLIQKINNRIQQGEKIAIGTDQVIDAIMQRKVEQLAADENWGSESAWKCRECEWIGYAKSQACPQHSNNVYNGHNLREAVSEHAISQQAAFHTVTNNSSLQDYGIVALLRF